MDMRGETLMNTQASRRSALKRLVPRPSQESRPPWMEDSPWYMKILKGLVLTFIGVVMLFPFLNVIAVSLSSAQDVLRGGLIIFPENPTLDAYRALLKGGVVYRSLWVSIWLTLIGTTVQMVFTTALAYGLSKPGVP